MSTENQIEANRLNAQNCTGPKTEEGKARSSQNALKSGLYSQKEVIATESREALDELVADFHTRFAPATPEERSLVDALVRYEWLSRRYMAADTAVWNFWLLVDDKMPGFGVDLPPLFRKISGQRAGRYFNSARKGYASTHGQRALNAIQSETKVRRKAGAACQQPKRKPTRNKTSCSTNWFLFRQPAESPGETPEPSVGLGPGNRKKHHRLRHEQRP